MPLAVAAGLYVVGNAFAADNGAAQLRDAAQEANKAATQRDLQMNAEAKAQAEQHQADVQADAAHQATGISGTLGHGASAVGHKVKAVTAKTKAGYHKAMANHYQHEAAADISATLAPGAR
jgi:hypothetical protein